MRLFRRDDFQALAALLNRHISVVPPAWQLTDSDFKVLLERDYPRAANQDELCEQQLFRHRILVAPAAGDLAAAVSWNLHDPSDARWGNLAGQASIEWLVADVESASAAQELLGKVAEEVSQAGGNQLRADLENDLGVGWFGVPETWPCVLEAFDAEGYEREDPWKILTRPVSRGDRHGSERARRARQS
jgi:hypothetical protein